MEESYYRTKESVAEYIKLSKDVNGLELTKILRKYLPVDSTLLEIGSGPGSDWIILKEYYDVTGSDFSAEFIEHLMAENPNGEFQALNAITLDTDKKFDGIYSNKVLHHLSDVELLTSIQRQCELLSINGIICHSFWKGEGTEIFKGLFVNYHDKKSLEEMFEDYFNLIEIQSYAEFDEGDSLLLIGKKK